MSLHFAPGVDWRRLQPQIALALAVASECYAERGEDCLVTSITRGTAFSVDGYHALGAAADLAVRRYRGGEMIPNEVMDLIVSALKQRLGREGGGQFDVVDERKPGTSAGWTGSHIHLEFDPK